MLVKAKPFKSFFNDLDNLFYDDLFYDDYLIKNKYDFNPLHDIFEDDKNYSIDLYLPAFKKEDVSLNIEEAKLIVKGERKQDDVKFKVKQGYFGKFMKTYTLPNHVNRDEISAEFIDGVLKIKVPKSEDVLKKKLIEIK
jgi:HSP20 family protein